jgi:hypothetical protein
MSQASTIYFLSLWIFSKLFWEQLCTTKDHFGGNWDQQWRYWRYLCTSDPSRNAKIVVIYFYNVYRCGVRRKSAQSMRNHSPVIFQPSVYWKFHLLLTTDWKPIKTPSYIIWSLVGEPGEMGFRNVEISEIGNINLEKYGFDISKKNNKGVLGKHLTKLMVLMAISSTLKFQYFRKSWKSTCPAFGQFEGTVSHGQCAPPGHP